MGDVRRRWTLVLAALLVALLPATAAAHARLTGTTPAAGARLERPPDRVLLHFDEPVETRFAQVRVVRSTGAAVPTGDPVLGAAGKVLRVTLDGRVRPGGYAVGFRVVSADGHPIAGRLTFRVAAPPAAATHAGHATAVAAPAHATHTTGATAAAPKPAPPSAAAVAALPSAEAGPVTRAAFAAVRGLDALALALALGLCGFLVLCWRRALAEVAGAGADWTAAAGAAAARASRMLLAAALVGIASGAAGVVLEGAIAGGTSAWAALDRGVLGDVVATRAGLMWGVKAVLWATLAGSLVVAAPRRALVLRPVALGADGRVLAPLDARRLGVLAVPLLALAAAPAIAGHAVVRGDTLVTVPATVGHVLAMGLWLGGIAALALLVPAGQRRLAEGDGVLLLGAVARRFSPLALGCVLLLMLTGTVQSVVLLDDLGQLTGDPFGRVLLLKLGLVAAVCALGAVNRRGALPRLRRGADGSAAALLRRTVRAELALLIAVLAVTGALIGLAPSAPAAPAPGASACTHTDAGHVSGCDDHTTAALHAAGG